MGGAYQDGGLGGGSWRQRQERGEGGKGKPMAPYSREVREMDVEGLLVWPLVRRGKVAERRVQ